MTDAVDIYRAAKLVIDRHGEEAPLYAAAKAAVFAGEGDDEAVPYAADRADLGSAVWRDRHGD